MKRSPVRIWIVAPSAPDWSWLGRQKPTGVSAVTNLQSPNYGVGSSIGRASDCESDCCGFEPRPIPHKLLGGLL